MKRIVAIVLACALLLGTCAYAADVVSFTSKSGKYAPTIKEKTNSIGSDASVNVSYNSGSHSMYYQVHKSNGSAVTNYNNTKSTGSFSLSYNYDGNGESFGRTGFSYRLRVAHRSQCTCSSGYATVTVDYTP